VHASEERGESTHQSLGNRHECLSWFCQRQQFWRNCSGWLETQGWAGWRLPFAQLQQVYSSAQRLREREGEQFDCATLVHATKEITTAQSTCLFKAADLSVGYFHSSSTLNTTANMKQNGMEEQYLELHLAARDSYFLLIYY